MSSNKGKLSNLLIAGVHKAGTTSLYSYLAKHPQICPSFKKEIGFFVPLMFGREIASMDTYAQYFDHCGSERYRLEASPSYLYGKEKIAQSIKQELGEIRILIILRDPTDRLVSFFNRAVSKSALPANTSLSDYLQMAEEKQDSHEHSVYSRGIREGKYIDYIVPWQRLFGDNLKILFFEDLKKNAYELTTGVCRWLHLDTECYALQDFTIENKTVHYRYRRLHRYLMDAYMRHETFWRRNEKLKKWVRGAYNKLNADVTKRSRLVDNESIARLSAIYEPHNKKLKSFLQTYHYESLPGWLD